MEWTDSGIILSLTRQGEHDAILEAITPDHGRHKGFVKAGMSRRQKGMLQPGNQVKLTWRSRIEENLGSFKFELLHSPLGMAMSSPVRLSAMTAALAVYAYSLPEREPHGPLYFALKAYLDLLEAEEITLLLLAVGLAKIEIGILRDLGFGLDFSECAATGVKSDLIYVSPKSGRAVSADAGRPYHSKLLALPEFMINPQVSCQKVKEALDGLSLTSYFLNQYVWIVRGTGQPASRERFISQLVKAKDKAE